MDHNENQLNVAGDFEPQMMMAIACRGRDVQQTNNEWRQFRSNQFTFFSLSVKREMDDVHVHVVSLKWNLIKSIVM